MAGRRGEMGGFRHPGKRGLALGRQNPFQDHYGHKRHLGRDYAEEGCENRAQNKKKEHGDRDPFSLLVVRK